jgi:hypothetical protein
MKRTLRAALCTILLAVPLAAIPRSARGEILDIANAERVRTNRALAAGLGGAVLGYYCQRMDYAWFHHVMPRRFSAQESAFLLGGWLAVLTYSGTLAALSKSGTAQSSAGTPGMPLAWPEIAVDGLGHTYAGAGMRF